jgi:predicted aldo/keto reductase-like oxidoreductase
VRHRVLGGLRVSAVGLGAMPLSIEGRPDESRALATIHAALDAGVTLLPGSRTSRAGAAHLVPTEEELTRLTAAAPTR